MSITKSYNKYNNTYYAYEVSYEWSDKLQKKVQKKHCIGKYDPITGEIVPNGKVGRPKTPFRTRSQTATETIQPPQPSAGVDVDQIVGILQSMETKYRELSSDCHALAEALKQMPDETGTDQQ